MDKRMRQAIFDSFDAAVRMRSIADADHTPYVTVGRVELRRLLDEHFLICGFALGASPLDDAKEVRDDAIKQQATHRD